MLTKIFTVENGLPKPTLHCYFIPELKTIIEKYPKDHVSMLAFCFYKSCPYKSENPYADFSDIEKDEILIKDFLKKGTNIVPDNLDLLNAIEKLNSLYMTTSSKYLQQNKKNLEDIMEYIGTTTVTDGKEGNLAERIRISTTCGKTMTEFIQLEKIADLEKDKIRNRAGRAEGRGEL